MALTVTNATALDGTPTAIRCEGRTIVEVGADIAIGPDDQHIDAGGMALTSPLVNGHTHAAMTLFRGFGDDLPLMEWLETKIWPAEAALTPDDCYWATRLACIEMIRSGTSRFFDMYWHGTQVARAVADAGMRATVSVVLIDGLDPAKGAALRGQALESLDELRAFGDLITPSLGPHAIYTVSSGSLEWLAEVSADRGVPVQIHLSETRKEVDDCVDANDARPAPYLDRLGLLGPDVVLAHGCWLDAAELELIGERGATVVTNPTSNMKLAGGRTFPYPEAVSHDVPIGLGTDGTSSNNNLDLLEAMKVLALTQKHSADDPAVLPAGETLAIAQGRRSALLGGTPLERGQPADFLLIRTDLPETSVGDLAADLVYAANGYAVDTTVVSGRVLMRDRRIEGTDEVIAQVRERSARLTSGP
jgi:5-methylthioadenosine/S-adenosylhomocysteine deaminase